MREEKYNNLIDAFAKTDAVYKRNSIIKELKILLAVLEQSITVSDKGTDILISKHIFDDESDDLETEFLTKVYAYLKSIEELFGTYVLDIANLLELKEEL